KLPQNGGASVKSFLDELRRTAAEVAAKNDPAFGTTAPRLQDAIDSVERASEWLLHALETSPQSGLAGAAPYLRMFANAAGGAFLAREALAASRLADGITAPARIALARFFAENVAVAAGGLERTVTEGAEGVNNADAALA